VLGAGATRRFSAVRWGVAGNIVAAWIMTVPCAALVGAGMQVVTRAPGGSAIVLGATIAIAGAAFLGRSWETRRFRRLEPAPALPPS
jgi:PiT family inorganic phosphate transporter